MVNDQDWEILINMKLILNNRYANQFNIIKASVLCLFMISLVSCVNYKGIHSHKNIAQPSQFPTKKSIPTQKGHWPTTSWAKQFGDPQLISLINEALANNPDIHAAQARVVQARALAENRHSAFFPKVNLQSQVIRGKLSATLIPPFLGGGDLFTFGEFLSTINYELDIWGKNLANFRQAMLQEKASEVAVNEARLTLSASVAYTYTQLAYYYALRQVLQRTVVQRVSLDNISSVRLRNGLDTKVQVYQSQNTTENAKTQLLDVDAQIILTRQQLGTLLGAGPDRGLSIKRPQLRMTNTVVLPPNLPFNLLGRRPDIVSARLNVEAACQGVKVAKAKFYPNVNIAGLAGFLSFGLDRLFEQASTQYQLGPAINLPLFDGNNLRAQLKGQYGAYEEAVANYNATLNHALSDVATQITDIYATEKKLNTQKAALYSAEHAYNLSKYQYRTGLASQVIVLDAETLYLNAQQQRLQLLTHRYSLQIALIKALGGGFEECCNTHPIPKQRIINESK